MGMYLVLCFFFNDTATTEIYTLSLHDALPICAELEHDEEPVAQRGAGAVERRASGRIDLIGAPLTLIPAASLYAGELRGAVATGTSEVGAVANLKQVIQARLFGREAVLKLTERRGFVRHRDCMPQTLTCRKGISAPFPTSPIPAHKLVDERLTHPARRV